MNDRLPLRLLAALLAPAPILFTPGCVGTSEIVIQYTSAEFNERIRRDLHPLTADDRATDLAYGLFRDGSDGGLVSEIFPLGAATSSGPGKLIQTRCLFL